MKSIARLFLFLAAFTLALGQPMIPVNNISPVTSNTLIGGPATGTSGRAMIVTAGAGITISGGQITASGGGGSAPSNAPYILKTPVAALTNSQALSLLGSGLMWSTTGTGVITTLTMSGDATINSSGVLTLANTAVTPGTYGSATAVPTIIVDAKGRVTSASNTTITATGNVTGPGSSTDRAIATWNSTGGTSLRNNSGVTIDASNNVVTSGNITGNVGTFTSASFGNFTTGNLTVTGNLLSTGVADGQIYIGAAGTNDFVKANLTAGPNIVIGNGPNSITIGATTGGGGGAGTGLFSGGGVALAPGGGFDITVSAASYAILNSVYASPMTNLTLSASDPTNPRIDVVAVNTSGAAVIITGTPSATPAKPDVDPATQLELTFFLVQAASTDLDVDVVDVYLNNAEWTTTESGGNINVASTNNPYTGALCIEGTTVTTNNYVQFVKPAAGTFDMADSDNLVFYIRSKASWANNRLMTISVRDGTNQLGSAVTFDQGLFGFNSANTTTYQQIIVPTALFAANGLSTATTIRITVGGSGGTLGFYIDDVTLQGGVASITDATRMLWRGNWSAILFYNPNDTVLGPDGRQYVAIQAGVGNTPSSSPTFWQPSSAPASSGTVTSSASASPQWAKFSTPTNIIGLTPGTGVETFVTTPTFTNLSSAVTGATIFSNTTRSDNLQAAQQVTLSSSGTDTFVGTAGVTATAYTAGRSYTFVANNANTGAASLNIDTLGAKTIVKVAGGVTTTLADNDIRSGQVVVVAFDATNDVFQIQSTLGNASSSAGSSYILLRDEKTAGTNAGTFTGATWVERELNVEAADSGGYCTLSANQFTLLAGTYRARIHAPAIHVDGHVAVLYNITDSAIIIIGTAEYSNVTAPFATTATKIEGRFTIASTKTFNVQHRCTTTRALYGLGVAANLGVTEVYTVVELEREP